MSQEYTQRPTKQQLGPHGWIQGIELASKASKRIVTRYFGGVRYAQPPTGSLRFRRTRPLSEDFVYGSEETPGNCEGSCQTCPQPGWPGVLPPMDASQWNEDCLHANIWVPAERPPPGGWPVLFFIHGGFLQFGSANKPVEVIAKMYEETKFKAIVVMPAYRVNLFGFLASYELQSEAQLDGECTGNMGFWDQRVALEWTARVIPSFGGNPDSITVAGYSAGAHSVFHQLSHDLYLPSSQSLIKRAIMWSNGSGVQPKALDGHQKAFDELLSKLEIPSSLSAAEKLDRLRRTPAVDLITALDKMRNSQFRGFSDGEFVGKNLINNINSGDYGQRMKKRGVKLFVGECRDEHNLYRAWKTPQNSWQDLHDRLLEDYPAGVVDNVMQLYAPGKQLPKGSRDWAILFGKIYADLQVHSLERGFIKNLSDAGLTVGKDILRYRIEMRVSCADTVWPLAWSVTHATDDGIWWWGNGWGDGLTPAEKQILSPLHESFSRFVAGETVEWEQTGAKIIRRLTNDGTTDYWEDSRWEEGQAVWRVVNGPESQAILAKL